MRFDFRKVTDMGSGAAGRLAGEETGKVGGSQIAKALLTKLKKLGYSLAGNEGCIEGLARRWHNLLSIHEDKEWIRIGRASWQEIRMVCTEASCENRNERLIWTGKGDAKIVR